MKHYHFISLLILFLTSSCIENKLSSKEQDDIYFTKKDIIEIEEEEEIQEETEVEEVEEDY